MRARVITFAIIVMATLFSLSVNTLLANDSGKYDFVVAADGSGDFTSVQAAIDAVPDLRKNVTSIFIKNGVYKEKLTLSETKTNVTFIGENRDSTILTFDDYAQRKNKFGEDIGTSGSSSFFIFAEGFTAYNITFENSAGPVGQAVAVRITSDKVRFFNCRFLGNQDTLYPHGRNSRQYYKNCYIEGTVDFIFGSSTAVFDSCTIFAKRDGYLTAASTIEGKPFGLVFIDCKITGSAPEGRVYFGRPWRPNAKTAFINCEISNIIRPEGWHDWGKESNHNTTFYCEYNNKGLGADTKNRVDWCKLLTDEEAKKYSIENIFNSTPNKNGELEVWDYMK